MIDLTKHGVDTMIKLLKNQKLKGECFQLLEPNTTL